MSVLGTADLAGCPWWTNRIHIIENLLDITFAEKQDLNLHNDRKDKKMCMFAALSHIFLWSSLGYYSFYLNHGAVYTYIIQFECLLDTVKVPNTIRTQE